MERAYYRGLARGSIYWTDLKRERFLLRERDPGPEIQDILMAKLVSPGDLPNVVRHDASSENIKSLVGAGSPAKSSGLVE